VRAREREREREQHPCGVECPLLALALAPCLPLLAFKDSFPCFA